MAIAMVLRAAMELLGGEKTRGAWRGRHLESGDLGAWAFRDLASFPRMFFHGDQLMETSLHSFFRHFHHVRACLLH